ncbi:hypothetical protein RRG08_042939 [Elysia crispata]|uniref:Uncharacterized protein n=1 Tax=Elysia crispata TaxID=231223 RepID=A0AAE1AUR4_9GAST|nr:hypothetical protein RRG08_042939 [Elysia crispata]
MSSIESLRLGSPLLGACLTVASHGSEGVSSGSIRIKQPWYSKNSRNKDLVRAAFGSFGIRVSPNLKVKYLVIDSVLPFSSSWTPSLNIRLDINENHFLFPYVKEFKINSRPHSMAVNSMDFPEHSKA